MSLSADARDLLKKARKLITPRKAWTQKVFAADSDGHAVLIGGEYAVCWCAEGALRKAEGSCYLKTAAVLLATEALLAVVKRRTNGKLGFVSEYNDTRSHRSVLSLFDEAARA